MTDSKTKKRLDDCLSLYYNSAAYPGEKEAALSGFNRICSKHGIDGKLYMRHSKHNPENTQNTQKSRPTQKSQSNGYQEYKKATGNGNNSWDYEDMDFEDFTAEEFFRNIFRQAGKRAREESTYKSSRYTENANKWFEEPWTFMFHVKEPIFEDIGLTREGNRYIRFNALAKREHEKRWPIQAFVIFSKDFDFDKIGKLKGVSFRMETGRTFYFNNRYLAIKKIWIMYPDGKEIPIFYSDGG